MSNYTNVPNQVSNFFRPVYQKLSMIHLLEYPDLGVGAKMFQMLCLCLNDKCFFGAVPEMNVNLRDGFQSVCIN